MPCPPAVQWSGALCPPLSDAPLDFEVELPGTEEQNRRRKEPKHDDSRDDPKRNEAEKPVFTAANCGNCERR
jgi:hypothetical protein